MAPTPEQSRRELKQTPGLSKHEGQAPEWKGALRLQESREGLDEMQRRGEKQQKAMEERSPRVSLWQQQQSGGDRCKLHQGHLTRGLRSRGIDDLTYGRN
jgi:hypothetical protein